MKKPKNLILVIFGASGDLTHRMLIPALYDLYLQDLLPHGYAVLGVSRTKLSNIDFREKMMKGIKVNCANPEMSKKSLESFCERLYYEPLDPSDANEYQRLNKRLTDLDDLYETRGNYIFYLATPPSLYDTIPQNLSKVKLNIQSYPDQLRNLVIEKPFGNSLKTAQDLNKSLLKNFYEHQIFRIDHYLGKETVQNLLVTRFSNGIFEPLWNRNYIDHVEITSAESIGVENRGGYYDKSGALIDMVQNHLLQLTGLIAMEPPTVIESRAIRNEILKVFQSLRPVDINNLEKYVIRGQYTSSTINGNKMHSYREENGVHKTSKTDTFVALKFFIDNWRWAGVPFYIRTGKRLPTRVTEIVIHFRKTPHPLFGFDTNGSDINNVLVVRIQPDEGILLKIGMKIPGKGFKVREINLDFHYKELSDLYLPSAYERLLLDCMFSDSTLYLRGDAVEAAWQFIDPVKKAWGDNPSYVVYGYPAGTWGPKEADDLIEGNDKWRYPCKNLANDGDYCEL